MILKITVFVIFIRYQYVLVQFLSFFFFFNISRQRFFKSPSFGVLVNLPKIGLFDINSSLLEQSRQKIRIRVLEYSAAKTRILYTHIRFLNRSLTCMKCSEYSDIRVSTLPRRSMAFETFEIRQDSILIRIFSFFDTIFGSLLRQKQRDVAQRCFFFVTIGMIRIVFYCSSISQ